MGLEKPRVANPLKSHYDKGFNNMHNGPWEQCARCNPQVNLSQPKAASPTSAESHWSARFQATHTGPANECVRCFPRLGSSDNL